MAAGVAEHLSGGIAGCHPHSQGYQRACYVAGATPQVEDTAFRWNPAVERAAEACPQTGHCPVHGISFRPEQCLGIEESPVPVGMPRLTANHHNRPCS